MIGSRTATASKHMFSDLTPTVGCGNLNKYFTENNYNLLLLLYSLWVISAAHEQQRLPAPACIHPSVTALGHVVISYFLLLLLVQDRQLNAMHTDKTQIGMRRLKHQLRGDFGLQSLAIL